MDALPDISGSYYRKAYEAFKRAADYGPTVNARLAYLEKRLPPLLPPAGSKIRVLSVGSGKGDIDILLLKRILLPHTPLVTYDAVEPNSWQLRELNQAVAEAKLDSIINVHHCTLDEYAKPSERNHCYDLVVLSHVLYYVPLDTIANIAKNFLPPGRGTILAVHNSPAGLNAPVRTLGISSPNSLLIADALDLLKERNIPAEIDVIYLDRWIEVTAECFEEGSEEGLALLGFFTHKDLRGVESDIVDRVRREIDVHKIVLRNGRKVLWAPECVALIQKT